MPEEVKIIVRQETQGTALRDAERDAQRLQAAARAGESATSPRAAGTPVDWAGLQRQRDEARRFMAQGASDGAGATGRSGVGDSLRADDAFARRLALQKDFSALQKQAAGDTAGAAKLEREAALIRRSQEIQRSMGVDGRQADEIARREAFAARQIDSQRMAQRQAAAAKEFQAQLSVKELRAKGDNKGAESLERENRLRQRAIQLEQELGVTHAQATKLAGRESAAQEAGDARSGGGIMGISWTRVIGSAVAAGLGLVKRVLDDRLDASTASADIAAGGVRSANATGRIARIGGVRGEGLAVANAHAQRDALDELQDKRGQFGHVDGGLWDDFKYLTNSMTGKGSEKIDALPVIGPLLAGARSATGGKWETAAMRAERENEERIAQAKLAKEQGEKLAEQKFTSGTGGLDLQRSEAVAKNDLISARALEYKVTWLREYNRLKAEYAPEEAAQEGASNRVFEDQRERAGNFARLVDARTGTAGTAQMAIMANAQMQGDPRLLGEITALRADVNRNSRTATDAATRYNFSR